MNIWASWCVPCKEEHPILINLANQKEIEIIGLNYKDNFANAQNFLSKLKNPYKIILSDKDGTIAIEWGAYGVPETFLIYNKKIIKKFIGPLNENSLSEIKRLVK
jgi:cytochrome c biogenesis protein CcmG/thiol:disulfide interchange protein DsbE